jgi:uncharacterized membrane protein YoaK (UPF0700 family)
MTPAPQLSLGLLLTAAAGFVDVVGFIELGGYFISFMSGNITQLGDALAHGVWPVALLTGSLVALFFLGSLAGSLLALWGGPRWGSSAVTALVLASFALTLLLALAGGTPRQFMLVLAGGAGAQNAILPAGSVRLGATFVTGTLFAAGQDLARALHGLAPPWRWAQHMLVWAALLLGGLLGGLGYGVAGLNILLVPGAIYLVLLIVFLLRPPQRIGG